jgi:hypothetical protein
MSTISSIKEQPKSSWWQSFFSSTSSTDDKQLIKTDKMKLDECNAKLPEDQKVLGGRRRKSAKKSNKRRRPAKKSLFNITKKWNPFAK